MSYWSVGISQGTVDTHSDMEEQDGESSIVPAVNPKPYFTLLCLIMKCFVFIKGAG